MKVQSTYRGRTYKEVTVDWESDETPTDNAIIAFAMRHQNETPVSLFGWHVTRVAEYPQMAVVTLNTD